MMLKRFFSISAAVALLLIAGCGGGGGTPGTPGFGSGTTTPLPPGGGAASPVADVTVVLSSPTIANTGTGTVTATVTALDANRNALPAAAVTVSANNGAVVTISGTAGSVTDSSGRLLAQIGIGSDLTNRDIEISAAANGITRKAVLKVVNSPTGATPTSVELIAGSTSVGTGGDGVLLRAFVKDSNNNALAAVPVAFSTTSGTLTSVSTVTDVAGVATATISAGSDRSNRTLDISVSSGTVSNTLRLPVTGTKLTLSGPSALIRGTTTTFDVTATDSKGAVIPNINVTASSSLGNSLVAVGGSATNSSGQVRFNYTAVGPGTDNLAFSGGNATVSPNPALVVSSQNFAFVSPAPSTTVPVNTPQVVRVRLEGVAPVSGNIINFAATGGLLSAASAATDSAGEATVSISSASAGPVTVQATFSGTTTSTTLPLVIVATTPNRLVLQLTPTAVAPNFGTSTANQVQVVARVTDAAGNPVQGQTVNFSRVVDPSGGNLLQASAITDSSGQASVAYRPGSESTANNGVVLSGAVASAPAVTGSASLTVNQTALFIALGTGNTITNLDPQTYRKDWVVYVTDSNGIPVNGATLTIKAIPTDYLTGNLGWNGDAWVYAAPIHQCRNEDRNSNGVLDPGEDDNLDGVLWPGNVIAVSPGNVQTVNGLATISLTYAESYSPWVRLKLTASATVSGTESSTSVEFTVTGAAVDFSSLTNPPAGAASPFGASPRPGTQAGACTQLL